MKLGRKSQNQAEVCTKLPPPRCHKVHLHRDRPPPLFSPTRFILFDGQAPTSPSSGISKGGGIQPGYLGDSKKKNSLRLTTEPKNPLSPPMNQILYGQGYAGTAPAEGALLGRPHRKRHPCKNN